MELKFDPRQEFQVNAIESVAQLFDGQPRIETEIHFVANAGFLTSPNRLDLGESDLLTNLQSVQASNDIPASRNLEFIEQMIDTGEGSKVSKFANFSVEMETGTGKTYVYIRTALELNKRYGFRRFIIVVPSIAIKEGVLKTFDITQKHFRVLFDNMPYKYYSYDSNNLAQVRQFCSSSNVEFMVMTLDSFNKAITLEGKGNVIRRPTDQLQGAVPIHLVQASRPILILDEPQNMESEKSIAALAALKPMTALRYSATHRNPYSLVYRLSPADAYRQGLVKKIEVASVIKEDDVNQVFVRVSSISSKKTRISAELRVNKLMKNGTVKETPLLVRPGDSLRKKTNLPEYEAFDVDEINPGSKTVLFSNGVEVKVGDAVGADRDAIFEAQIRYTIEEHFRKQTRLRQRGIKVLTLFFIDRVDNYVSQAGIVRRSFSKAFNELKQKYQDWEGLSEQEVQAAYFASRKRGGDETFQDTVSGESEKDAEAYDLIMKAKERLLSLENKVAFIFSHSALREGWDNPNIFQICTLNQTASEIKKRQEVGRGIRLAVNQDGERVQDPEVNLLTVVANQSYEKYVRELQEEIVADYGEGVELPPQPRNAKNKTTIKLRKEFVLRPEFQALWDKIAKKTKYYVEVDTERLISETLKVIDTLEIKRPRVVVEKARLDIDRDGSFQAIQLSRGKTFLDLAGRYPLPNLAEVMSHLLENTSPPVRLSRKTLVAIFSRCKTNKAALDNPFEFASVVARVLKEKLADLLVTGIQYEKNGKMYEMSLLADFETFQDFLEPVPHSVYDKVPFASTTERDFVEGMERNTQVKLYIRLPYWFRVCTPVGDYIPDWGIVWEEHDVFGGSKQPLLYLVRETKKPASQGKMRGDEGRKLECGRKHFTEALKTNFKVCEDARDIYP